MRVDNRGESIMLKSLLSTLTVVGVLMSPAAYAGGSGGHGKPECHQNMSKKECNQYRKEQRQSARAEAKAQVDARNRVTSQNQLEQQNSSTINQGTGATIKALPHSSVTTNYDAYVDQMNKGSIDSNTTGSTTVDNTAKAKAGNQ
jgi:hypothetical protein